VTLVARLYKAKANTDSKNIICKAAMHIVKRLSLLFHIDTNTSMPIIYIFFSGCGSLRRRLFFSIFNHMPKGMFSAFAPQENTLPSKPSLPKPEEGVFAAFREAPRDKAAVSEAGVYALPPLFRQLAKESLKALPWEKLPGTINEIGKGSGELRDSVGSFVHRSVNPSEELVNEALASYFRKLRR
jgi:hypothetical protein